LARKACSRQQRKEDVFMKLDIDRFSRRARLIAPGALLLSLAFFVNLGWAQEAPRQEGSTQIKPPMIKPPMQRSKNANSGSVNAPSHRKRSRRRRRTRSRAKVTSPLIVPTSDSVLTTSGETRDTDTEASTKPQMVKGDIGGKIVMPPGKAISGGILNGKAVSLPKPTYPPIARAARASGKVVVQVIIDEEGNVIEARAVSGHPLLQQAAVEAARRAKFTPTRVGGQPVKVIGTMDYNFVL
jgi:TonB family protein